MTVVGVDFTAAPSRRKPIVVARGVLAGDRIRNVELLQLYSAADFWLFLHERGYDRMGIDAPFSLPQEFLKTLDLSGWRESIQWAATTPKSDYFDAIRSFVMVRPVGNKEPKRACDALLNAASPLKLFNPGVGWMHYALAKHLQRLEECVIPFSSRVDSPAILEVYPGSFAKNRIGRLSYKNDPVGDADRPARRVQLIGALKEFLDLSQDQGVQAASDPNGDILDALIALAQTAMSRHEVAPEANRNEGWIYGASV